VGILPKHDAECGADRVRPATDSYSPTSGIDLKDVKPARSGEVLHHRDLVWSSSSAFGELVAREERLTRSWRSGSPGSGTEIDGHLDIDPGLDRAKVACSGNRWTPAG